MKRTHIIIAMLFAAPALIACGTGTAHIVRADAHGGEVALEGTYMDSVATAHSMLAEHCQGRFTIRKPGEPGVTVLAPNRGERLAAFDCVPHPVHQIASSR